MLIGYGSRSGYKLAMATIEDMKRILSAAIVGVLLAPLLPLFGAANSESSLPPCCRRDGKHHCAMMAAIMNRQQRSQHSPAFRSVPEQCPFRATFLQRSARHGSLYPATSNAFSAANVVQTGLTTETGDCASEVEELHPLQRGPPQFS